MSARASSVIDKMLRRTRLSDLTPILSPTEDNFFYCENDSKQSYIGGAFIATTLNGMNEQDYQLFVGSLNVKLPPNSIIQFSHLATNHLEDEINDYITEHFKGDCLLAVGDEDLIKIHFHTNEPWQLLEYCSTLGEIYDIVVEDMDRQSRGLKG